MNLQNSQIMPALIDEVTHNVRQLLTGLLDQDFEGNIESLSSHGVDALSRGFHRCLLEAGRLGLERYIQSFESDEPSLEVDGERWHRSETSKKDFLTMLGEITLIRGLYYKRGESHKGKQKALVPLDRAWDMQERYATPDVVEGLLCASVSLSPVETAGLFAKLTGISPSTSLIYNVIQKDGKRLKECVAAHEKERWEKIRVPDNAEVIVFSADGANVCLREAGCKRGRPAERPLNDETSPESAYRNVMVGALSTYQTNEVSDTTGETQWKPERISSHYLAEMPEQGFGTFRERSVNALKQLRSQFPESGITKLLIMDGARNLWHWAREESCFEDFDWLLDFYHASEHLSLLAEALFGKQSTAAKKWYRKWRNKLKHKENAVEGLIRSIDYHIKTRKLSASRRKTSEREKNFFINNQEQMNYAIYVELGYPIGSGPVESACKTIVKERLCRSGMRWNRESGGNVLNLRVLAKSQQWAQMWSLYRDKHWELEAA